MRPHLEKKGRKEGRERGEERRERERNMRPIASRIGDYLDYPSILVQFLVSVQHDFTECEQPDGRKGGGRA